MSRRSAAALISVLAAVVGPMMLGCEPVEPERRTATTSPVPAYRPPPEPGPERWKMPHLWDREPPFPYLPGEDRDRSRSIGGVVHGYLVGSVSIPQPHPGLAFLDVQYDRGLFYTTDRMRTIVSEAAAHVRKHHPEAVVRLGNFGRAGGGDIPYSFSHNSGRDADLGFFLRDSQGKAAVPPDLVSIGPDGRSRGEDGTYRFDVERNWRLVEGLVRAAGDQLQYLFLSNPLRRRLLERAEQVGTPDRIRRRARAVLHQPSGSLPHDDHFHVRIYCSRLDVESGCWDRGIEHPWYDGFSEAERRKAREARSLLTGDRRGIRSSAARRLALLDDRESRAELVERLEDRAAVVRAAAARSLGALGTASEALVDRLGSEDHPQAYLETVDALGRLGTSAATRGLVGQLGEGRYLEIPGEFGADSRTFVADALIRTERTEPVEELVELLASADPAVRRAGARALRHLTNHRFGEDWGTGDAEKRRADIESWRDWIANHGDEPREAWLRKGFRAAGYEVDRLDGSHVWALCRAVEDRDHLSYNAQRTLMRIADRYPESLSWSKEDARVFWTRWFERRRSRYGTPPVPDDLATLE